MQSLLNVPVSEGLLNDNYGYHSINVITFIMAQNDHINRLLLYRRSQKSPGFLMKGVNQMHDSAMSVVKPLW